MAAIQSTPVTAILIRGHDYGEGHRLLTLLTREAGKITAVARGIRKPKAKLASILQHFTKATLDLTTGRQFAIITGAQMLDSYYGLRADLRSFANASYLCELFDETLEDNQGAPELFDLLAAALSQNDKGTATEMSNRYVEIHLISALGYLPRLTHCAHCNAPLAVADEAGKTIWPVWLGFTAAHGGALCINCLPLVPGARRIAAGTIQVSLLMLNMEMETLSALNLSTQLKKEIEITYRDYLEYQLGRELRSSRYINAFTNDEISRII